MKFLLFVSLNQADLKVTTHGKMYINLNRITSSIFLFVCFSILYSDISDYKLLCFVNLSVLLELLITMSVRNARKLCTNLELYNNRHLRNKIIACKDAEGDFFVTTEEKKYLRRNSK